MKLFTVFALFCLVTAASAAIEEVYEIHRRVDRVLVKTLNYVAFYAKAINPMKGDSCGDTSHTLEERYCIYCSPQICKNGITGTITVHFDDAPPQCTLTYRILKFGSNTMKCDSMITQYKIGQY